MTRMLILELDGVDKKLVEEFNCENLMQKEAEKRSYGGIDNTTGIPEIVTPALFTTFYTGMLPSEHSVTGIGRYDNPLVRRLEGVLDKVSFTKNFKGVRDNLYKVFGVGSRPNTPADIEGLPFPYMVDSITINLPVLDVYSHPEEYVQWMDTEYVKNQVDKRFFETESAVRAAVERTDHDLVHAHFHAADYYQHLAHEGEEGVSEVRKTYEAVDEMVSSVKRAAEENGFTHVLYVSDHGQPTEYEHNDRAYYAANWDVGVENPHLTDFKEVVMEVLPVREGEEEASGNGIADKKKVEDRLRKLGYL